MKDERIRIASLSEYYGDLLKLDAWRCDRTKAEQAQVLVCSQLDAHKALIDEALAQAAKKRGLSPDEMRAKILAGEEI